MRSRKLPDVEAVFVEMRDRKSNGDGGLISDLIKQEKQVRRGRLASANPTNPAGRPAVFCKSRGRDVW
jgi:hypothetical protein